MRAHKPVDTLLKELETQVERHLALAVHTFQNLDETTLQLPSSTGGWSIVQCLWHLNSYGHFYLPEIRKGVYSVASQSTFKSGWLGAYCIRMMDPGSGKKQFKALKGHVPPLQLQAFQVVAEYIEQQETLLIYLRKSYTANLNTRLPVSVSNLITLKLGDVLQFVIAHDERHLQQALRNIHQVSVQGMQENHKIS